MRAAAGGLDAPLLPAPQCRTFSARFTYSNRSRRLSIRASATVIYKSAFGISHRFAIHAPARLNYFRQDISRYLLIHDNQGFSPIISLKKAYFHVEPEADARRHVLAMSGGDIICRCR